jgi:hypothetical protein
VSSGRTMHPHRGLGVITRLATLCLAHRMVAVGRVAFGARHGTPAPPVLDIVSETAANGFVWRCSSRRSRRARARGVVHRGRPGVWALAGCVCVAACVLTFGLELCRQSSHRQATIAPSPPPSAHTHTCPPPPSQAHELSKRVSSTTEPGIPVVTHNSPPRTSTICIAASATTCSPSCAPRRTSTCR